MKLPALKPTHDSKWKLVGRLAFHITILILIVALFPLLIAELGSYGFDDHPTGMVCYADGSPHLLAGYDYHLVQAWIPSLFLDITMGSGKLTFPQAKGIDIVWDLVAGRGGQVVMTVLSYPILRRTLTYCMEKQSVPFSLFSSFTHGQVSVRSLFALATCDRHVSQSRARSILTARSWLFAAMALVGTYLLAFPTIVTSMAGYQSNLAPFAKDPTNPDSLLPVSRMQLPYNVVVDGPRIGLTEMYPAYSEVLSDPEGGMTLSNYYQAVQYITSSLDGCTYTTSCANFSDPAMYNRSMDPYDAYNEYDFELHNGTVTLPMGNRLYEDGYASNIAFSFPQNLTSLDQVKSNITFLNATTVLATPPLKILQNSYVPASGGDAGEQYLWVGTTMLNRTWLLDTTVCQADTTYRWGFSSGLLLLFAAATALYTILVVTLHWVVHSHSRADRHGHHVSVYRDALDLAEELKMALGVGVVSMTGAELDEEVRGLDARGRWEIGRGVGVETQDLAPSRWDEMVMRRKERKSESAMRKEMGTLPAAQGSVGTLVEGEREKRHGLLGRLIGERGSSVMRRACGGAYDKAESDEEEGQAHEDLSLGKHMM
ncbi:hypothetical protein LTR15_012138 [Elasticomyces elasticus]|nr:hypothetical protein LTR15_012138 [Elasticomyces elasticus]